MDKLKVIEIERFAIHDGPGIRSVIFLQGCPLHCPWCANIESQSFKQQVLYNVKECLGCRKCVEVCPKNCISSDLKIARDICDGCGKCVDVCLGNALKLVHQEMSVDEIVSIVMKDFDYYQNSGGGVTLSGGEALVHPNVLVLLKTLKDKGLHVAVETTGQVSSTLLKQYDAYIDLYLWDIKHYRKEKYASIGGQFDLIMENIQLVNKEKIIARVPVIPNYNFEDVEGILQYISTLDIREVHLLPFHRMGEGKYRQLDKEYAYRDYESLRKEDIKQMDNNCNILVKIGG